MGSAVVAHGLSCFADQGSNLCPPHWEYRVSHWTTKEVLLRKLFLSSSNERQAEGPILGIREEGHTGVLRPSLGHFQEQVLHGPVRGMKTPFLRE